MTNEEINALTDYEINCMVAKAIGLESVMFFAPKEEADPEYCTGPVWDVSSGELYCGFISEQGNCFSPCNDPAVMMPIVFANGISIVFDGDGMCSAGIMRDMDWEMESHYSHANPLRAAAIVYLKMKGVL